MTQTQNPRQNFVVTYFDLDGKKHTVIEFARNAVSAGFFAVENVRNVDLARKVTAVPSAL